MAAISGIVTALAMPSPGWWPFAWVGLVPLFVAMRGTGARSGALYGFVAGAAYFAVVLRWMTIFGYLPWFVAAVVVTPLFVAGFGLVASRLMPERSGAWGYVLVPAAWAAMQWLRSLGPAGFTWGSLAHTQANAVDVIQMASIVGPWGIDFVVCAVNLAIAGAFLSRRTKRQLAPVGVIGFLVVAAVGWGHFAAGPVGDGRAGVRVAVVQGNLPQGRTIDQAFTDLAYSRYAQMTEEAARGGAKLIVWPETTLPVQMNAAWDGILSGLARRCGADCVIGGYDPPGNPGEIRDFNSACFYDASGRKLGAYHKVQLVPYGEYVPLRQQMPWLERYGIRAVDVLPGKSHNVIETDLGRVGVSICFESLFPRIARAETRDGAQMLIVMTNDSWFLRTQAARGHLMMSKLRAVENRRYLVRAAATGISTIIDPYGRPTGELGIFERGVVSGQIRPMDTTTIYTRTGDLFAYACALIALAGVAVSRRLGVKDSDQPSL